MKYQTLSDANLVVDSYMILTSFSKKAWYLKVKLTSKCIRELIQVDAQLKLIDSTIDEAISLLTLLNYSTINDHYYRIPDRILTEYLQISRKKVRNIIQIISNTNLLNTMWIDGELQYKLNFNIIKQDKFIKLKREKMYNRYDDIRRKICNKYDTYYYYPYHNSTVHKAQRESIIGLSLAMSDYNKISSNLNLYNKRNDIYYIEIPYEKICKVLNITENELLKKLQMLSKQTSYIKKHNLVYIDGKEKHFYNKDYKNCPLVEFDKCTDSNRPKVTKWSYIIFKEAFETSNIYKSVMKKQNYFKAIINNIISPLSIETKKSNILSADNAEVKTQNICNKGYSVIDLFKIHQRTTDKFRYNKRIKIPNIVDLSLKQVNKYIKLIVNLFNNDNVNDSDMKYYISKYKQLENQKSYLCSL